VTLVPRKIPLLEPGSSVWFPDPRRADAEGLVAVGGDLTPARLLFAYDSGIFPWYDHGFPPMWWSPDPRAVMDREHVHIPRRMRAVLEGNAFSITHNRDFAAVVRACADERICGTWILPEMIEAYVGLHGLGHAHSLEVWQDNRLVGGIYGVQRGALFAAESMFHRVTNASKVALLSCIENYTQAGIELFDVQFLTGHLRSLGAYEISRTDYLSRLPRLTEKNARLRFPGVPRRTRR
jgi:leucyl/phenylalanyl-tRNA---protein transferase